MIAAISSIKTSGLSVGSASIVYLEL